MTPPVRRAAIGALLVALAISLSGCVYLRLLRFKNQLSDFDAYARVDRQSGLGLVFSDPVLLDSDFVFITDSQPTAKERDPSNPTVERWSWVFVKDKRREEDQPCEITFVTQYEDSLLTRIDFDPHLIRLIPPDFIVTILRSMGEARINKLRRSATAEVSANEIPGVNLPTTDRILQAMGEPTRTRLSRKERIAQLIYVFNFLNPDTGKKAGQFRIVFKVPHQQPSQEILGFAITGKGR